MAERGDGDGGAGGDGGGLALRPFWSGTLSFGLVSVPVQLYPANRRERVSLRTLAPDGTPLERRYWCPEDEREVSRDEIVRGYEIEPGEWVRVEDSELAALAPAKSRDIDLERFVAAGELDPAAFDRAYFLTPAGDSTKAYRLLARVMEETGRAGVATFVMRGKEYLVAILAERGILRAETLRFADELRTPEQVGLPAVPEVAKSAVSRFRKAIRAAVGPLERSELEDHSADRFLELVEAKRRRGEDTVGVAEEAEPPERPPDLMNVLKFSLERAGRAADAPEQGEAVAKPAKASRRAGAASSAADRAVLEEKTKAELYERAKAVDLPGRSSMSKEELVRALAAVGDDGTARRSA